MRRFRSRRRRVAATLLLALAAFTATGALAESAASPGENARLDASSRSVPFGDRVTLRGTFPGANKALIEIRHRARGATGWRTVAVRVVDRGPFAGNREFDLTSATKQALGFPDVGTVLTSR